MQWLNYTDQKQFKHCFRVLFAYAKEILDLTQYNVLRSVIKKNNQMVS